MIKRKGQFCLFHLKLRCYMLYFMFILFIIHIISWLSCKLIDIQLESPELHLTGPNKLGRTEYFNHLRNARFCLAPRGESSWTLRFYESFFVVSLYLTGHIAHS